MTECHACSDVYDLLFSVGSLLLVVCAVKLLRFAFCNTPKQYLIVTFTVFFFKYDYRNASETFLIDYFIVSILLSKVKMSPNKTASLKNIKKFFINSKNIFIHLHSHFMIDWTSSPASHYLDCVMWSSCLPVLWFDAEDEVYPDLYRPLADHLGLRLPCLCSTLQCSSYP